MTTVRTHKCQNKFRKCQQKYNKTADKKREHE